MLVFEVIRKACIARRELRMRVAWMAEGDGRGINECFLPGFDIYEDYTGAIAAEIARICGEIFARRGRTDVPIVIPRVKKARCAAVYIGIADTARGA